MGVITGAGRSVTNLPTAVRGPGLAAGASSGVLRVREVGIFNTSTSAVCVGVAAFTTTGTQAGAVTEYNESDSTSPTPGGGAFLSMSTDATVSAQVRQASLGAAIGAGIIWTWGELGLVIPEGTANGIILNCPTGTAQHIDFYIVWSE